ncbi:OmpA family protein [Alkalispirochaeta americana]|nr:OmpA family protein [Alkalispirochaeta americana]
MVRSTLLLVFALGVCLAAFGEAPEWTRRTPFSDDAYYGKGRGSSREEALESARQEILRQLRGQVRTGATVIGATDPRLLETLTLMSSFFEENTLRGAVETEILSLGETTWVLLEYPKPYGLHLIHAAAVRYARESQYNPEDLLRTIQSRDVVEALRFQWRLSELNLENYDGDNIQVVQTPEMMHITIFQFLPETAQLSRAHQVALRSLSTTLFQELQTLSYRAVDVLGHANPTGAPGEEAELQELSLRRARIMADNLRASGLEITTLAGAGGDQPLADGSTPEGGGRNRRVEISIHFE